jgi:hypothetical protein
MLSSLVELEVSSRGWGYAGTAIRLLFGPRARGL